MKSLYRPLNQYYVEVLKANQRKRKINKKEVKSSKGFPKPIIKTKIINQPNSLISKSKKKSPSVNIYLYSYPFMQRYRLSSRSRITQQKNTIPKPKNFKQRDKDDSLSFVLSLDVHHNQSNFLHQSVPFQLENVIFPLVFLITLNLQTSDLSVVYVIRDRLSIINTSKNGIILRWGKTQCFVKLESRCIVIYHKERNETFRFQYFITDR